MSKSVFVFGLMLMFLFPYALFAQDPALVEIRVSPEKVTLRPGEQCQFSAKGYTQAGREIPFTVEWSTTGGFINTTGLFSANDVETDKLYTIMATDTRTGAQGNAAVLIRASDKEFVSTDSPKILRLEIIPPKIELTPGQPYRFTVRAYSTQGQQVRLTRLLWRVTGGSIMADGTYQAGGAPGSYFVEVKEPNGVLTKAEVVIRGDGGKLASIRVAPTDVVLKPFSVQKFTAVGYDNSGYEVNFQPLWEATGGNIENDGLYRAGGTSGTYYVKAIAPSGLSSIASIQIQKLDIARVEISPKGAILSPGQSQKFEVKAYNRNGELIPVFPNWSATGGVIQGDGTYYAGRSAGNYLLTVNIERITVEVPIVLKAEVPKRLVINPTQATLAPGEKAQFEASVYNETGQKLELPLKWMCHGGGTIDTNGIFTAGKVLGKYVLEVSAQEGLLNHAWITVAAASASQSNVKWLTLRPSLVRLVPGGKAQFQVKALDASGAEVTCPITWMAEGGKIENNGIYTAGDVEGKYPVTATTAPDIKAISTVLITGTTGTTTPKQPTESKVYSLRLQPLEVNLKCGEQCNFQTVVLDQAGNSTEGQLRWEATGGTVDVKGNYRAGDAPGTYSLAVTETQHNLRQEAKIYITQPAGTSKKSLQIERWQVGHGGALIGQIYIKGIVNDERAFLVQLTLFERSGSQKTLAQMQIHQGESFEFEGEYVRETASDVSVMLYDKTLTIIDYEKRSTP